MIIHKVKEDIFMDRVKQDIHKIIDTLPAYKLEVIHLILLLISDGDGDDVLTPEETADIDRRIAEYRANPSIAVSLAELKARCKTRQETSPRI
jgi:hypothetical protein